MMVAGDCQHGAITLHAFSDIIPAQCFKNKKMAPVKYFVIVIKFIE